LSATALQSSSSDKFSNRNIVDHFAPARRRAMLIDDAIFLVLLIRLISAATTCAMIDRA
jgi:hypothetical protein